MSEKEEHIPEKRPKPDEKNEDETDLLFKLPDKRIKPNKNDEAEAEAESDLSIHEDDLEPEKEEDF